MRNFFDILGRRRERLVARSAAQRGQVILSVTEVQRDLTAPVLVTAGAAVTLFASSPKLRGWLVRGWAVYSLVRRLLYR
jgi:hypothetical protein